jgi:hypothetical protein
MGSSDIVETYDAFRVELVAVAQRERTEAHPPNRTTKSGTIEDRARLLCPRRADVIPSATNGLRSNDICGPTCDTGNHRNARANPKS